MHAMIFWGFIVLTIATTVVMIDYDFGIPIMRGYFYLVFQSFLTDVFGGLAMLGICMAAGRRLIARPKTLVYTREASIILIVFLAILFSGFLIEGWRMAATDDPWGAWSPVGYLFARLSRTDVGGSDEDGTCDDLVGPPLAGFWLSGVGPLHQNGPRDHGDLERLHGATRADRRQFAKARLRDSGTIGHPLARGFQLEGLLGLRRLHGMRPMHGRLPRPLRGQAALTARHHS